jgi:hypothetical protein
MRHLTFLCYAYQDRVFRDKFLTHLAPFKRNAVISEWSDKEIKPGKPWKKEIQKALEQAQAAVLLVSPEFIASDFIHENELPPLLAAAKSDELTILWVPISYSSYTETPIAEYQAASDPSQPLKSMTPAEQDRIWVEICAKLKHATWSLKLELDASDGEVRGNALAIKGRATFRPRGAGKDAIPETTRAFKMMDVQLVPFVFASSSGWWAQAR